MLKATINKRNDGISSIKHKAKSTPAEVKLKRMEIFISHPSSPRRLAPGAKNDDNDDYDEDDNERQMDKTGNGGTQVLIRY